MYCDDHDGDELMIMHSLCCAASAVAAAGAVSASADAAIVGEGSASADAFATTDGTEWPRGVSGTVHSRLGDSSNLATELASKFKEAMDEIASKPFDEARELPDPETTTRDDEPIDAGQGGAPSVNVQPQDAQQHAPSSNPQPVPSNSPQTVLPNNPQPTQQTVPAGDTRHNTALHHLCKCQLTSMIAHQWHASIIKESTSHIVMLDARMSMGAVGSSPAC